MTDSIRSALRDLAEDAPEGPENLAGAAWTGGQRLRRRRSMTRIGLASAATVAVCAAMIVVTHQPEQSLPLVPATSTSAPAKKVTSYLPAKSDELALPQLPTQYPAEIDPDPADAVPLKTDPVKKAIALFQPDNGPVLVLGDDGRLRVIENGPRAITNAGGDTFGALRQTSLSFDGRTAVFPQRDEIMLVDLTTGNDRRIRSPGLNEHAVLSVDSARVAVTNGEQTLLYRLSDEALLATYAPVKLALAGNDLLVGFRNHCLYEIQGGRPDCLHMSADIFDWWGLPAVRVHKVVATAFGGYEAGTVVALMDNAGLPPSRVLGVPMGDDRWKGGTRPLHWLDDRTVLLLSDGLEPVVLAWNTETGQLTKVMHVQRRATLAL